MTTKFLKDSVVRSQDGNLIVLYRGDYRAKNIAGGFKVIEFEDGGSGGLYFTDSADIASSYSKTKEFYDENTCIVHEWIKLRKKDGRLIRYKDISTRLSNGEIDTLYKRALNLDADGGYDGDDKVLGEFTLKEHKERFRRPDRVLSEMLFHSGFMEAKEFLEFLRGSNVFAEVIYDDPYEASSVVTPVYLDIRNPFNPYNIDHLHRLQAKIGADHIFMQEKLENYSAEPDQRMAVTYIPRDVRKAMLDLGFDGVVDIGGVSIGDSLHNVWIAFDANQAVPAYSQAAVEYRASLIEPEMSQMRI